MFFSLYHVTKVRMHVRILTNNSIKGVWFRCIDTKRVSDMSK